MQNITRIYALSKRNVILRYKNSLVGFFWGFVKPALYLLIFIPIFGGDNPPPNFVLYVLSGLVLWFFFANVTGQAVGSIVGSAGLIKSLNIPSYYFPLSETLSELFNLMLTLIVFVVIMYWFGIQYTPAMLLIIPCILLFAVFSLGLNLLLCSLNVFFRDVGIIWNTIQPALFFLTPIAYSEDRMKKYEFIVKYNPIRYYIKLGRDIFYDPAAVTLHMWTTCAIVSVCMYVIGQFVFNRLKNQFISAI